MMHQADKLDRPLIEEGIEEGIEAPLWRNLYLTKGGKVWGMCHPTERLAKEYSDAFFSEWPIYIAETGDDSVELQDGGHLPFGDFLCAIPVPVFKED